MKIKKTSTRKKKLIYASIILIIIVGSIVALLSKSNFPGINKSVEQDSSEEIAETTSEEPSAQSEFVSTDNREPGNTISEQRGSAIISDEAGSIDDSTDTSNPISSSSGEISVYTPSQQSIVRQGSSISGTSTLNKINYRIIDNVSGVIALGELSVVNGRFAGKLDFTTNATEGRIDIYSVTDQGVEFSNVNITVRFK